jgi:nucleoside-diphosphate-sugar epimerase
MPPAVSRTDEHEVSQGVLAGSIEPFLRGGADRVNRRPLDEKEGPDDEMGTNMSGMAKSPRPERRVVVTGAAGFIGSHLVDHLLASGDRVVGIDSFEDYYPRPFKEANIARACEATGFTLHEENLLELASSPGAAGTSRLDELLSGADLVVHLAAQAGVRASWGSSFRIYSDNNVLATQMVLETCRRVGVPKVVYASSSSVYGDTDQLPMREDARCLPMSPYGVSKLAGEQLCRLYWKNFGVPAVALRFFTVYGPRQRPDMAFHRFLRAMHDGEPLEMYGAGDQTRDFTFVSDIVAGIAAAAERGRSGAIYNLGGGSRVTLREAIDILAEASGLSPGIRGQAVQAGDVRHTWADVSRAAEDLGYLPRVGLAEGLRREAEWFAGDVVGRSAAPAV